MSKQFLFSFLQLAKKSAFMNSSTLISLTKHFLNIFLVTASYVIGVLVSFDDKAHSIELFRAECGGDWVYTSFDSEKRCLLDCNLQLERPTQ